LLLHVNFFQHKNSIVKWRIYSKGKAIIAEGREEKAEEVEKRG
jgi:hypothetical protein